MRIGRKGWVVAVVLTVVCACGWLLARGCAPSPRSAPDAAQLAAAVPEDGKATGSPEAKEQQDVELPLGPLDDPAFLDAHMADVIKDMGKRPDLGEAAKGWQAQESALIEQIAKESFQETLV